MTPPVTAGIGLPGTDNLGKLRPFVVLTSLGHGAEKVYDAHYTQAAADEQLKTLAVKIRGRVVAAEVASRIDGRYLARVVGAPRKEGRHRAALPRARQLRRQGPLRLNPPGMARSAERTDAPLQGQAVPLPHLRRRPPFRSLAMSDAYESFLATKRLTSPPSGFDPGELGEHLFPHQADLTRWALRRGKAAIFAATGLGKSRMQLTWAEKVAEHTGGKVLVLAPLAVAKQTVREASDVGIDAVYARSMAEVTSPIVVTNYEMLHAFDTRAFVGIVLDESSILKAFDGKFRALIIETFRDTPYRLACTATPAPNDHVELANHAEFLSVMTRAEMLATFFIHDGADTSKWRLKGHARAEFWRWVCSWAALVRKPSDLGYEDGAYNLPPLTVHHHIVEADTSTLRQAGQLFAMDARTLTERRAARKASASARVEACAEMVNASGEQWIVWCDLNAEGDALEKSIAGAVQVAGADTREHKEQAIVDFCDRKTRVLVSKPSIFGFGVNAQNCARMAFVGLSDSWEAYYQAIRRIWRFGQDRPCEVHIFTSPLEGAVVANIERKERDAAEMAEAMSAETCAIVREAVRGTERETIAYAPTVPIRFPAWLTSEGAAA
jgi:hypothetical protein